MRHRHNGLGKKPDDEWSVGEPPSRSGRRRIIPRGEGETPYYGGDKAFGNPTFEFLGVEFEAGHAGSEDTISWLSCQPQTASRPTEASSIGWLMEMAVEETSGYVDRRQAPSEEPLDGYQPETTEDYRDAQSQRAEGDGGYALDQKPVSLTKKIAEVVTREGGRIPCGFTGTVQNEGYSRSRRWTVYGPGENPYHVAAAVMDNLREQPGVTSVDINVGRSTAAEIASELQATRFGYEFDPEDEQELMERALRELRWESGLSVGKQIALKVVPTEARQRLDIPTRFSADTNQYQEEMQQIGRHPGDAWDYYEITISTHEEADNPYYG